MPTLSGPVRLAAPAMFLRRAGKSGPFAKDVFTIVAWRPGKRQPNTIIWLTIRRNDGRNAGKTATGKRAAARRIEVATIVLEKRRPESGQRREGSRSQRLYWENGDRKAGCGAKDRGCNDCTGKTATGKRAAARRIEVATIVLGKRRPESGLRREGSRSQRLYWKNGDRKAGQRRARPERRPRTSAVRPILVSIPAFTGAYVANERGSSRTSTTGARRSRREGAALETGPPLRERDAAVEGQNAAGDGWPERRFRSGGYRRQGARHAPHGRLGQNRRRQAARTVPGGDLDSARNFDYAHLYRHFAAGPPFDAGAAEGM